MIISHSAGRSVPFFLSQRPVDLSNADLSGADLTEARFYNVDLTNADLSGATLVGMSFGGYSTLEGANLTNATIQGVTWAAVCPDGTFSWANGQTCCGHFVGGAPASCEP